MRTPPTAAVLAALAAISSAAIAPAHADSASKPPETVTVGATVRPGHHAVSAHRLDRVPQVRATASDQAPVALKAADFGTALAPAAMSVEQRQKLEAGIASASPVLDLTLGSGKAAERSTILPPAADARSSRTAGATRKSLDFPTEAQAHPAPRASRVSAALGVIPRPEWTAGAKPREVSTISPAGAPLAPPKAAGLRSRAARTSAMPKGVGAEAHKAGPVITSRPRDPSLPSPSAIKAPATDKAKEVQP